MTAAPTYLPKSHLLSIRGVVFSRVEEIRHVVKFFEKGIADHQQEYADLCRMGVEQDGEPYESIEELVDLELWEMDETLGHAFRRSIFLTAYAVLEHDLDWICERHAHQAQLGLQPSDLNGKGIQRSATYFKKVLQLPFPSGSQEWQTLLALGQLRNAFAHRDGRLAYNDRLAKALLDSWHSAQIRVDGVYLMTPFIEKTLDAMAAFWTVLFPLLRRPHPNVAKVDSNA